MRQAHATQHIGCLSELNIVVTNDLHSVTPGVAKIEEWTIKQGNTSCLQCLATPRSMKAIDLVLPRSSNLKSRP
jgi:hypothetical protein